MLFFPLHFKLYTVSRNGRLNIWECDTKLDGLVKRVKNENVEEIGTDGDELASTKKNVSLDDLEKKKEEEKGQEEQDIHAAEDQKVTIHYKKVAK